ncbi:Transposase IS116/IS110/IS902 family protein [compost metagenome]
MAEQAVLGKSAAVIRAIQGLRGIALISAIVIVAEIGQFSRFRSPLQLMAYLGMVPREYSSGASTKKGRMTKTGNNRVRRIFIEAAWSYRYKPVVKGELAKRLESKCTCPYDLMESTEPSTQKVYEIACPRKTSEQSGCCCWARTRWLPLGNCL